MANFIKDFYYNKLEPWARRTKRDSEAQKISETLSHNEKYLLDSLSGDDLILFQDYVAAWGELLAASDLDSFISGFRFGAGFALDTFASDTPGDSQPRADGAGCCTDK